MTVVQARSATSLTFVRVGGVRVAVPSARVDRVRSALEQDGSPDEGALVDLADFLGLARHADEESTVLLSLTGAPTTLVARMPLVVSDVAPTSIHPVPDYLATWARARGLAGVVIVDHELTYLLDADAFERVRDAHPPTGTSA